MPAPSWTICDAPLTLILPLLRRLAGRLDKRRRPIGGDSRARGEELKTSVQGTECCELSVDTRDKGVVSLENEATRNLGERTAWAVVRLEETFGVPHWEGPSNPLDSLIRTVLSQSTNDQNRDRAYNELRRRFPTWQEVAKADPGEVAEAIRVAGLSNQKSVRLCAILRWIRENNGGLQLDDLCRMDVTQAMDWLGHLKGIGVKTIAVVLMFSCGKDVFPVDTHVHRILRRFGVVPENATAEKAFWLAADLVPEGKSYSLHINLLKLGRTVCKARKPECPRCPLNEQCAYCVRVAEQRIGDRVE